uniref:RNA-binding region-containing protein 3 n=1 Tax=Echeneis naucrates TaxID=173247 RepID=A0A665X255_ECHNA
MDMKEDFVQTSSSKTLFIRHLPAELNQDDKEDLLKYFGAESVRVFSSTGCLKHTAFATFRSEKSAENALARLHQLEILGHRLVAEFAKDQEHVTVLKDPPVSDSGKCLKEEKRKQETQHANISLIETGIAPDLGLKFQSNPTLKYLYPPPSNGILTNITHALMSVPKFYVQVLHLMNKMNLPCPFGPVTARPPMYELLPPAPPMPMPPPFPPEYPPLPEDEMELSSEESEYESGDDEDKERYNMFGVQLIRTNKHFCDPSEVDERQAATFDGDEKVTEGFGKLYPSTLETEQQEEKSDNAQDLTSDVISRKELEKGRLSKDEMKKMSVFKNYEPGEPTCRLYVKNIAKQVEEKDLKYIYGRYIDPLSETERNMFDIVLMKEGRMKGQAFVGLPGECIAEKALRETNGYVLYDKPLVVVSFYSLSHYELSTKVYEKCWPSRFDH